jgi:GMP synthase (glutamine-hydrolysing)
MSHEPKIIILKTGDPVPAVEERRGPFAKLIQDTISDLFPGSFESVDVRTEPPPNPRGASAIIITGSAAHVPQREPWVLSTESYLRDVVPSGVPVFGICFGHQLLAQALGGEVIRNPRGREIGTRRIEKVLDDVIFESIPSTFEANATHLDTVGRLPPGAVVLARSPLDDHQAVRFSKSCYGVQFHPEVDADVMGSYVSARREILLAEGFDVDAMLAAITDATFGRQTLRNFIQHIVSAPRG